MPRKPRHKQGPRFRFTLNWENIGGNVQGVTKVEPLGRRTKQMGVTFWAKQSGDDGWKLHYVPPQTPYRRKHEKYIRENFPEPTPSLPRGSASPTRFDDAERYITTEAAVPSVVTLKYETEGEHTEA